MTVAIPLFRKVDDKEIPIKDRFGRVFRRIFATKQDVCEVCTKHLRRNNPAQIIKYCSREHRRLRHRGLKGGMNEQMA